MPFTRVLRRLSIYWPVAAVAGAAVVTLGLQGLPTPATVTDHDITITARQYAYEPHRIVVNSGDQIRLRLISRDVVHGFFLEGHDIEAEVQPGKLTFKLRHPSYEETFREVEDVVFTAGRPGKYRYRCSVTCGTLHPFMLGELVVRPNSVFYAGAIGAGAVLVLTFALMFSDGKPVKLELSSQRASKRVDLLRRFPWLDWLVSRRWFPFALVVPNLVVLFFFIIAGLFGSPIGNRNIIVTVVWILWWFLLITLLVPVGGRAWCMVCPLPFLGEWFTRRRLIGVRPEAEISRVFRSGGLNRRWPRRLSGIWLPSFLFLGLCSFSMILVTRPALTAVVLGGMLLAALVVHGVFRRRTFCRYLCPLNAWMSIYSMTAMTEVRPRNTELCKECTDRSCVRGSDKGWGCPWLVNPSRLVSNNYCGLCMECIKACPNHNLTVWARPFCADTTIRRHDEAWMAFIMITLAIAYSVTLLGPWGFIKMWANVTEVGNWGGFALHTAVIWLAALVVVPGLWYLAASLGRPLAGSYEIPVRVIFVRYSYLLIPLGLLAWTAFSFPLIMVNYSHVISSLSDPLGWGWDLFGTAQHRWSPLLPEWVPYIQIPLLLVGLGTSLTRGQWIARELFPTRAAAARSLIPHSVVCTLITVALLRLFVG